MIAKILVSPAVFRCFLGSNALRCPTGLLMVRNVPLPLMVRSLFGFFFFALLGGTTAAQTTTGSSPVPASPPAGFAFPVNKQVTYNSVYVEGPYVALTFDDGPHETLTPKLLDLLARHKAKATFFVVGQNAAEYPEIMRRIAQEGHELANHSWSHPNLGKMSDEAVRAQLKKTEDAIRRATGRDVTLMRPPYGSLTQRQRNWVNEEFGYKVVMWDVDPLDWKRPGMNVVTNRIVGGARNGSIILVHDIHPPSVDAMRSTLEQLGAKGFKFVTVSELLAMERPLPAKASPATAARPAETAPVRTPLPLNSPVPSPAPVR